ncbi:SAM-dependent methyltransferase [Streptomyces lydicus]|nr:SAM-dependent methyltransferase [Streptomyces lydicus]MCZ1012168.1 SAM-dependent methyltransferase [Streptomyces lydicus]
MRELRTDSGLGQDRAHSARMYDYYLGGKSNYIVDRQAAEELVTLFPAIAVAARANRAYMHRAGRFLARQGVRQFVDVGIGMPAMPNLHEVVQSLVPDATVVYVDNDPIVLVYADELGNGTPEGAIRCVEADVRQPNELLAAVERTGCIDFDQPVALSLHALLDFIPDELHPHQIVGQLLGWLAPNSYLSLTHCTGDFSPDAWRAVVDAYGHRGVPVRARTKDEVRRFFHELDLVDPGLTVAHRWRPAPESGPMVPDKRVALYAAVARESTAL